MNTLLSIVTSLASSTDPTVFVGQDTKAAFIPEKILRGRIRQSTCEILLMSKPNHFLSTVCALLIFSGLSFADVRQGHSKHGAAFDTGLRSKPWVIEGIGSAPFSISTNNSEVQRWYNQGNALLHNFWFEEAERAFRWCHKLEPENPMVYLGLARCGLNWFTLGNAASETKSIAFLKEAVKRKATVSERERLYIEAWEKSCLVPGVSPVGVIIKELSNLVVKYPNDIEAKAALIFFNIGSGSVVANDSLIKDILREEPLHPGAHHARIHNWDGINSDQAIDSCELYSKVVPGTGHSLHMPGHIYSKVGMWHEAAIAMDSSTRVELSYMNRRLALPYETWNYVHNRDYLCYIQEQLGRANDSMQGAKDIISAPLDTERDPVETFWAQFSLLRALIKFERWTEILDGKTLIKATEPYGQMMIGSAELMALTKTNRLIEAKEKLLEVQAIMEKLRKEDPAKPAEYPAPNTFRVGEAWLRIAEGDRLGGLGLLLTAAENERKSREASTYANDPPSESWPIFRLVGDVFSEGGDHRAAVDAYNKALGHEPNDAWCLGGLAKSWVALADREKAREFASQFLAVWSGADIGLRPMQEVLALNLDAKPSPKTLRPERQYVPSTLEYLGPSNWTPFAAPKLNVFSAEGKAVKLEDYRGKNVLLVFYLSEQCIHCVEQLNAINNKADEFKATNTVVLACSSDPPQKNKANQLSTLKLTLLSDTNHENARRFASYDDFEEMELHSTILIDTQGRVRWKRTGGDPFMKIDYLLTEIKRWGKRAP